MNAQTFLRNFEFIANAPEGVKRLRELVLHLGVQGQLVPQDQSELSAIECISQSNLGVLEFTQDRNKPAPPGWVSLPLGCLIASNTGGGTPSKRNPNYWGGEIPWASVKDIKTRKFIDSTIDKITREGLENSSSKLIPAYRLLVVTRMGLGKLAINTCEMAINQDIRAISPTNALHLDYGYLLFKSLNLVGKGVTVKGIKVKELHAQPVFLPPIDEQKRIVAKVDELMALCDKLEAQQQERERRFPVLSRACHTRFVESPTRANLKAIFGKVDTVSATNLRDTILTLAILGVFSRQNEDDESSQLLLSRLEQERRQFAKENKFRMPRLEPINDRAAPPLPNGWTWVRLNALFNVITDGDHQAPPKSYSGIAFLTIGNITTGELDFRDARFVSESYYHGLAPYRRPLKGDILYTVVGATYGRPAWVDTDRTFCVQRHIAILKPTSGCEVSFLMLLLKSPLVYEQATAGTTGTAQPTIPLTALRNFMVPLPPECEQRRIVAKVEQLMTLVDQLKEQQHRKNKVAEAFAQAAVNAITGTRINEQKESMKVPKTELVSRLQTKSKPKATDQAPLADLLDKNQGELAAKALWQQSGLEIDAFYQQLKTEMAQGWIVEPENAWMAEIEAD